MEEQKKKQWLVQVGTRVWNCRTQRGLSREKLAERLDITPQYVSDIEQGKKCMSMSIFVEMSQVLEVSMEFLAYGTLSPAPEVERLEQCLRRLTPLDRELAAHMLRLSLEAAEAMGPEE